MTTAVDVVVVVVGAIGWRRRCRVVVGFGCGSTYDEKSGLSRSLGISFFPKCLFTEKELSGLNEGGESWKQR
jgi:hypothetical protein